MAPRKAGIAPAKKSKLARPVKLPKAAAKTKAKTAPKTAAKKPAARK